MSCLRKVAIKTYKNQEDLMIPHIIHYCWFGKKEKSSEVLQFIKDWKRKLPNFKFVEWNETNFDINSIPYVKEAYDKNKFAFVSDVVRLYALQVYGGVYLDTDMEIKRDFTQVLDENKLVLGYENNGKHIMTAFIAAEKNFPIINELLSTYDKEKFIKTDGSLNVYPNTYRLTDLLRKKGISIDGNYRKLEEGVAIYPEKAFSAMTFSTMTEISDKTTYTVHHFKSSWKPWYVKVRRKIKIALIRLIERFD